MELFGILFCTKCSEGHFEVWRIEEVDLSQYHAVTASESVAYKIADALNSSLEEDLISARQER